ncbi:MAG TPA: DUF4118 domain-containing protein, partial [Vicinamibacteria bacterium]|nr:DUF4118 domain-containing protein [Vicinamibacteria bacterium]
MAYFWSLAIVAASTALGLLFGGREYLTDVVMLYVLGIVIAAVRLPPRASALTAVLSVVAFDVLFIPPYHAFSVADARHVMTFAVMLLVAAVINHLTRRVREHAVDAERERLRNALLSSVSHDLRTPLGVIEGAATALLDEHAELDASTRRDLLETIHAEAERLHRRVRDLLDMTRLEGGPVTLDLEWQSLEELVGGALQRVEAGPGGRVTLELPPSLPLVRCDAVLLEQVLVNLLENARQAGAGTVTVRVEEDGTALAVEDDGRGIPPDALSQV